MNPPGRPLDPLAAIFRLEEFGEPTVRQSRRRIPGFSDTILNVFVRLNENHLTSTKTLWSVAVEVPGYRLARYWFPTSRVEADHDFEREVDWLTRVGVLLPSALRDVGFLLYD